MFINKSKAIFIVIFLFILLVSISSATLLNRYVSVSGSFNIIPYNPPVNVPLTIQDCKDDGWMNYTRLDGSAFENQGQCVSYVATNMCKDDGWKILTMEDGSVFKNQGQCVAYFRGAFGHKSSEPGSDLEFSEE